MFYPWNAERLEDWEGLKNRKLGREKAGKLVSLEQ
jgi:hypothetical protein